MLTLTCRLWTAGLGGLLLMVWGTVNVGIGAEAPASSPGRPSGVRILELRDLEGRSVRLEAGPETGSRKPLGALLFFVLPDCPISNAYAPEIRRLCESYGARGFQCVLVYSDPSISLEAAKGHFKDYRHGDYPAVLDRGRRLARWVDARVAPEAVVVGVSGEVLYRGRINDWYADFGQRRRRPTRHDLREALDALLAGKPVPQPWPKAIGCYLPAVNDEISGEFRSTSSNERTP